MYLALMKVFDRDLQAHMHIFNGTTLILIEKSIYMSHSLSGMCMQACVCVCACACVSVCVSVCACVCACDCVSM